MGLSLVLSPDPTFGIKTNASGNRAAAKSPFIVVRTVSGTTSAISRITSGGMPSGPGAFPGFNFAAAVRSSSAVNVSMSPTSGVIHSTSGLVGKSLATASLRSSRLRGVLLPSFPVAILYPLPYGSFSTVSRSRSRALAFAA
jgi:hypothetical protein